MKQSLFSFAKMLTSHQRSILYRPLRLTTPLRVQSMPFCTNKIPPISTPEIPKQNLQIKRSEYKVGQQQVESYKTKGAISILDKLRGTKQTDTGQLYALMFTCTKCGTRDIRSFTKNAYHNGIVLIRCDGCKNLHLVADNIGWFETQAKNLDDFSGGKVQKVHDPVAITKFLNAAFDDRPADGKNTEQKADKQQKDHSDTPTDK